MLSHPVPRKPVRFRDSYTLIHLFILYLFIPEACQHARWFNLSTLTGPVTNHVVNGPAAGAASWWNQAVPGTPRRALARPLTRASPRENVGFYNDAVCAAGCTAERARRAGAEGNFAAALRGAVCGAERAVRSPAAPPNAAV